MAGLKPVLPSLIGRPQTARAGAHVVRMANALDGIGDAGSALANGAVRLGAALSGVMGERELADYRRVLNEAVAEADSRMEKDVFSMEGFSAEGASERAAGIYDEIGAKYRGQLSERNAQRFMEAWGGRRNMQLSRTMTFERGQLQQAQIGANSALMKSGVSNYVATLEPAALDTAREAYDDTVRLSNGGRLVNDETLARFDADVNDDDGRIRLPDGRTLRIVDTLNPDEHDAITRERLSEIRKNMELQAKAYRTGLQNLYDSAHAQVIDRYLEGDRIAEAESYLAAIGSDGYPQGCSAAVLSELRDAVGRKREAADIATESERMVNGVLSKGDAESVRYGSPEQDRLFTEVRRELSGRYAGEKWKTGERIVSELDMRYRLLQDRQRAALAADTVSALMQIQESGLTLPQQATFIQGMKDSPLRAALQKALDRKVESYNNSDDPIFVADQERKLNAFKLALGHGSAELDGVHYDFSDQQQLRAYVLNLGLTERNQKRAGSYIVNSESRIDAFLAGKVCARLLGIDDPAEALSRYPNLLSELDELKGSTVIEPSKMETFLRTNIAMLLSAEASKDQLWWDESGPVEEFIREDDGGIDKLYMKRDQLTESWRRFRAQQLLNSGDTAGAAAALEATPSLMELEEFARRRGYQNRKGLYYLRGGK